MGELVKKSVQILDSFADTLGSMKHGQQQEAINAALTMFFMANVDRKRFFVRIFRDLRDGHMDIIPRPTGHRSLLQTGSPEQKIDAVAFTKQVFGEHPEYLDEGTILDLPRDLDEDKFPDHLQGKRKKNARNRQASLKDDAEKAARRTVKERAAKRSKGRSA